MPKIIFRLYGRVTERILSDDFDKLTEITFPDSTTETLSYDDNG